VAKRIPVTLRWQTPGSDFEDYAAETRVLSRHGCKVVYGGRAQPGKEVFVFYSQGSKTRRARVVFRESAVSGEQVSLGLEFIGDDNFWQMEFPPARGAFSMS
jgi:hypothetical protein